MVVKDETSRMYKWPDLAGEFACACARGVTPGPSIHDPEICAAPVAP